MTAFRLLAGLKPLNRCLSILDLSFCRLDNLVAADPSMKVLMFLSGRCIDGPVLFNFQIYLYRYIFHLSTYIIFQDFMKTFENLSNLSSLIADNCGIDDDHELPLLLNLRTLR